MYTFEIIEDAEPSYKATLIERYCLKEAAWRYNTKGISGVEQDPVLPEGMERDLGQNGFAYRIYEPPSDEGDPVLRNLLEPMISRVSERFPFELEVMRIRAGLFLPSPQGGIHHPHVDYYMPHYTLLYYVNDADGDTYIWNEKAPKENPEAYPERFTLLDSISPKKGRAILFNGMHYHSSSRPKEARERIAITINLLPKAL
jgi:2OG-Fe(II) oxygenase superfamily